MREKQSLYCSPLLISRHRRQETSYHDTHLLIFIAYLNRLDIIRIPDNIGTNANAMKLYGYSRYLDSQL